MNRFVREIVMLTILVILANGLHGQTIEKLKMNMNETISKYKAKVGIAIHSSDFTDSLIINGDHHYPFQSVYKFHLGIAVLAQVDNGKFRLDQPIKISKELVSTKLHSPIRDKYPNGTTLPLGDIITYTVCESDNVGCDILFDLLGGPEMVQKYFEDQGYEGLSIKLTETVQQKEWDLQYQNWTKVNVANVILHDYYTNSKNLLSKDSYDFLWNAMRSTPSGNNRIKGNLPIGTVVAHKTGFSGRNKKTGEIGAVNDIGVVSLPDAHVFYISVFVTDSMEDEPTNAKIIAEVSRLAWDHFTSSLIQSTP